MIKQNAFCTTCDAVLNIPKDVEISEIITCSECHTRLVVQEIKEDKVIIDEAPQIEEDWGE